MRVLLLPPDRVEEGTKLWQTFELDRSHLLLAVQYIVGHLVNVQGLLLVFPKGDHSSPPQVLEGQLNVFILHRLGIISVTALGIFLWLKGLVLLQ